mgnify:CR=1 FL=1
MMFNSGYLLFALPALLFGLYAQFRIKSAYSKYLRVRSSSGMSGFEAAQRLLMRATGTLPGGSAG